MNYFKTGWVKNGNKWVQQQSDFYGWDRIGDINNPAYNWSEEILKLPDDEPNKLQTAAKEELIAQVKEAFWITCAESSKNMNVNAQTNDYPVSYGIQYQAETPDPSDDEVHIVDENYSITDAISVSDVKVPTLLPLDADNSGQIVANYGKLNAQKNTLFLCYER